MQIRASESRYCKTGGTDPVRTAALVLAFTSGMFSLSACKSRSFSESTGQYTAANVKAPRAFSCATPREKGLVLLESGDAGPATVTYQWTNDERVLTPEGRAAWLDKSFADARNTPHAESANALGDGLYLASNPVTTAGAGRILVVVPLKPGCTFAFAPTTDWEQDPAARAALESSATGVVYDFEADEKAIIVRDAAAIDAAGIKVIDTRAHEGEPIESITPKKFVGQAAWMDAAKHYGATYSFLASGFSGGSEGAALRDAKGNLTEKGYALALRAELESGGASRESALDTLIAGAPTSLSYPVCSRRDERFPYRGSKYHACISALFESVAVHVASDLSSSMGDSPVEVEEAHRVLTALGYGPLLPAITEAQTPFYKNFFSNWKGVRGKAQAAGALIEASLLFGTAGATRSLEDWTGR